MFKKLTFYLILMDAITSSCSTGCLKCTDTSATNTTKICVLCDVWSQYYLGTNNTCQLSNLTNCALLGHSGTCLSCNSKYYLSNGACVAVETSNLKDNCLYYSGASTCQICNTNYYLSTNACVAVATDARISNCSYYSSATVCGYCNDGYVIRDSGATCEKLPTSATCLSFTDLDCQECDSGYIINKNLYKVSLYSFDTNANRDILSTFFDSYLQSVAEYSDEYTCQTIIVDYCATAETFDKCSLCMDGYYLTEDKLCVIDPVPKIKYCTTYEYNSSQTYLYGCILCEQGYYVYQNECVAVTAVEKCSTYYADQQSTTYCKTCLDTHYLPQINTCTLRTNYTIANCATYYIDSDKCLTCNSGYFLSSDGKQCYQTISNCATHQSITSGNTQSNVVCTGCNDLYYLKTSTECAKGTITNCAVYQQVSTMTCSECDDQYYTASGGTKCAAQHPSINRCIDYDAGTDNVCLECQAEYSPVVYSRICKTVVTNTKAHCTQYNLSSPYNCQVCEDGFVLNSTQNTCDSITVTNCKTWNIGNDECIVCNDNYYYFDPTAGPVCENPPAYVSSRCSDYQANTSTAFTLSGAKQCNVCDDNASPLTETTDYACIEDSYLDMLNYTRDVTNCVQYSSDGVCQRCAAGYFINYTDNTCSTTCLKSVNPILLYQGASTDFQINECETTDDLKLVKGYDVNPKLTRSDTTYTFSCRTGLPTSTLANWDVYYTNINVSNFNSGNGIDNDWIDNIADVWPEVDCKNDIVNDSYIDSSTVSTTFPTTTYNQRLKLYKLTTNVADTLNYYATVRCNWGETGPISFYDVGGDFTYYVNCNSTNDFDSVYYYNIPPYWAQLFSVHKCNSANDIPVLAYTGAATDDIQFSTFTPWTPKSGNTWDDSTNYLDNIICMNLTTTADLISVLNFASGDLTNFTPMTNCGLAVLNLTRTPTPFDNTEYAENLDTARNDDQSLFCAACKPGYYENNTNTNAEANFTNSVFRNCVAIPNCNLNGDNNYFNGCGQCNSGYTWKYNDATQEILFDECVAIPSSLNDCMAYNTDNDECAFCKKGYYLNLDNHCTQITVDNCDSFVNYYNSGSYQARQYLQQYGDGCSECANNYMMVKTEASNNVGVQLCYGSSYLEGSAISTTLGVTNNTRIKGDYVVHCSKYNTSTKKCEKCDDGYVINDSTSNNPSLCTAFSNCDLTNAAGTACVNCSLAYAMVSSNCTLGTLSNCQIYDETTTSNSTQKCSVCDDGYYLNATGECKKGYIPFCKTFSYNQPNTCTECQINYSLVVSSGNVGYLCIGELTAMKCEDVTLARSNSQFRASCNTCDAITDELYDVVITENSTTGLYGACFPVNNITGCLEYDNSVVDNSTHFQLTCTKCTNATYYLNPDNAYECIARTKLDNNCSIYLPEEEGCYECLTGYYLNEGVIVSDLCIAYPTGDYHCIDYEMSGSDLICTDCEDEFYLANGVCNEITTVVTHCAHYSGAVECDKCSSGYFLTNATTCTQITITNCSVYESATSCSVCNNLYKKVTTNGVSTCTKYDNMTQCLYEEGGKCTLCATGYYPNNGICANATAITGCIYYDTQTTCSLCSSTYTLSSDKKKCSVNSGIDPNCAATETQSTPICSICTAGYTFSNSTCKANTITTSQGCFDTDENNKCAICISGWSMLTTGSCSNNNPDTNFVKVAMIAIGFLMTLFLQ